MIRNLVILISLFTLTSSSPSSPPFNFALSGTTTIDHNSITLTQHLESRISNPSSNFGRVFHKNPIQFLDSSFNSTVSFSTRFSFKIIPPPPPYLSGEGLAFLITSEPNSLPHSFGCIHVGLPKPLGCKFMSVEFDTNHDQASGDINDNHVGINLNSIFTVFSVDLEKINLKSGKQITAWIEYRNTEKFIKIWVGYHNRKPESPILVAPVDLSKNFNRFMYVGFSADNKRGSSVHMLNSWYFKTSSPVEDEDVGPENCLICFPEGLVGEEVKILSRNNLRSNESLVVLVSTLLAVLYLNRVRFIPRLPAFQEMIIYDYELQNHGENGIVTIHVRQIGVIGPIRRRRRFR